MTKHPRPRDFATLESYCEACIEHATASLSRVTHYDRFEVAAIKRRAIAEVAEAAREVAREDYALFLEAREEAFDRGNYDD